MWDENRTTGLTQRHGDTEGRLRARRAGGLLLAARAQRRGTGAGASDTRRASRRTRAAAPGLAR
ncbi:MAG: hypothetical protein AVDCRST_MAG68-416 [uncultured Gemmatimonadetes bacterium]|uniref:Uncharacterized protein n=1 Tax=uncultured Gemmatimonadota bacterium TaxID=203437 RepID=A0A6J4KAY9_9BACT|nr:MAG: hypothetical protein AVDCRST_MAG68-416 [uncultured Gemmatimonadota bacterium]